MDPGQRPGFLICVRECYLGMAFTGTLLTPSQ